MKTGEIACAVPDLHDYRLYDHRTGEPLDPVEAETLLWLHLDHCRQCQNRMIHDPRNRNLKRGGNAGRGNEWARKNVACTSLPSKFRNLSHQNRVNQTEAARLLLAWREREDIATAIDAIGWEKATYGNVQKRLSRDIDRELFTNVLNSGGHPSLPTVERTQFPYAYSNNNSCGMYVIDQPAGVIRYERMAVYDRFVDVEIYAPHIMRLHPNLTKVSRPTLRWNRDCVTWDVIVFEPKPRKEDVNKVSHVVGFDLNADWHGGISGARLSYNGTVSRELVAGIDTRRQQTVLEELYVQYQRCLKKLDRLMPWQRPHDPDDPQQVAAHPEWRRLYEQSLNLRDKMYRIKTLLDWRYAHDITDHAKPGELIAVEKLSPFDAAGRVEFRHGSQLENWNTSPPRPDSAWCRSTRRTRPPPARGAIPSTRSAKPDNTGAQDADVTSPATTGLASTSPNAAHAISDTKPSDLPRRRDTPHPNVHRSDTNDRTKKHENFSHR